MCFLISSLPSLCRYMQRGSLFKVLRKREGKPLEPKLQRSVATSVARGMTHLHSHSPPILHLVSAHNFPQLISTQHSAISCSSCSGGK